MGYACASSALHWLRSCYGTTVDLVSNTSLYLMHKALSNSTAKHLSIELSSKVGNMHNNSSDHADEEPSVFPV